MNVRTAKIIRSLVVLDTVSSLLDYPVIAGKSNAALPSSAAVDAFLCGSPNPIFSLCDVVE